MPSKGGGGGGGSIQTPQLFTPSGLYQGLSNVEGLGQYGQGLLNPIASMTNWAASEATGGLAQPIPSSANAPVTGPQVNIGGSATPADQWTTQFNPANGQITFTNTKTGEQFQQWYGSQQAQQIFSNQGGGEATLQQWGQLYNNRGATTPGSVAPGNLTQSLGPYLGAAWQQIESIPSLERQTQNFIKGQQSQENQFLGQGNQLFGQGEGIYNVGGGLLDQGTTMLDQATTGTGLFPSQQAYVDQARAAEKAQLSQQLAAEGLGSSTDNAILRGEAGQQAAATAGQLIQGNIGAAEAEQQIGNQTMGVGQQQISLAQQQYNLAQSAAKLVLGGQELKLGEKTAMAQLATGFQGQLWTQAMQGYGVLGQMMNTLGNLYGIDIAGYNDILQSHVQQNQIEAQVAEANAQLQAQASSSMGSGLGSIFGMLGGGGGGGGGGGLGGLLGGIGGLFGGGAAAGGAAGAAGVVGDILPLVAGLAF